ncbi:interleukin-12 subunit beta [Notolabrus celidotus]|uniref:interleukin-12 subunit beta n=1 Tax=Notolabrus celidotus TaxID=1203425 RepID=UPI00148F599D|nr:interleukin-12 subunit beta [Notolabrus celidotus]XP_034540025.1 interleukin-12 subunit beta [Notolabrus celidotus]
MRSFLLVALCAALCYASSENNQPDIETLMDKVLVLRVPYGRSSRVFVNLSCGEAHQNQPVFWKKDGEELKPALQGNNVKVLVVEMNGGNYTCHQSPGGEYLNHTVIMVRLKPDNRNVILKEQSPKEGYIHCSASNYNGSFHCSWTRKAERPNAAVLLVNAERHPENISCELDADGSGVLCRDLNCPHYEEMHSISLTVYLYSYSRLEAYTKTFYLRDIVRPAKLHNLHLSDENVFSWSSPETWEKPCTYFRLQFEVKVVPRGLDCTSEEHIRNNTTELTQYEVDVKTRRYVFCVRAQDKFTGGLFSHWSSCKVNKDSVEC